MRSGSSGVWAFAVALSAAPLSYLMAAPCGLLCAGCPLGGACLIASPVVFGLVLLIKSARRVKLFFSNLGARIMGREPKIMPKATPPTFIQIDGAED